jgi:PAS domain S-box-containing protein
MEQIKQYTHSIIEASLDPFLTINTDGKIMDVNEATIKVTGALREELIGADFFDYFTEPKKARESYEKVFKEGSVVNYPLTIRHKSGSLIDVLFNASVYKDEDGKVLGVSAVARDVTESKKALFYARSVIEAGLDPMITISPEGKVTDVNEAKVKITGVPREKLIGSNFADYFTNPGEALLGYEKAFKDGFIREFPLVIRHVSGKLTDVLFNASVYKDDKGNVFGMIAALRDVTASKQALFYARSVIEAGLDPMITVSPEGKITDVNEAKIKITGVSREKLIGSDFISYFTEPDEALQGYGQVFKEGFIREYPLVIRNASGKLTDVLFNASVYKDDKGNVFGMIAALRDVTTQKKIEEKLHETSAYAQSLIESSLDPLFIISPEGKVTGVNHATEEITGVTREWLIDSDFSTYFTDSHKARDSYRQVLKEGEVRNYPLAIHDASGKITDVSFNASAYKDAVGTVKGIFATARDVTEAKKLSLYARSIIEASLDPFITNDTEGKILDVNEATIKIVGMPREKIIGSDFTDYFTEATKAREAYEKVFKLGSVSDYPLIIKSQNGKLTDVLYNASLYKDDKGTVLGVTGVARDNTLAQQVTNKNEAINKELRALDVAKDEFVSIASHQLRSPLTAIKGYTGMLLDGDSGPINDKQRKYLGEMKHANDRMISLITALLDVSRVDLGVFTFEPAPTDFTKVATDVLAELDSSIKSKKLRVETNFEEGIPLIQADPKITRMIFQNLLTNAVKYTNAEGKISFGIKKEGPSLLVSVADTGYGIPENVQSKIFTKMFRADNARANDPDGTGLGLYVVKQTIEKIGGKIWFESKENQGTTFYISIPLTGMRKSVPGETIKG